MLCTINLHVFRCLRQVLLLLLLLLGSLPPPARIYKCNA
jgi:hypothetical protein